MNSEEIFAPLPPITESEWARILDGHKFRLLVKPEQVEWAGDRARSCLSCKNLGDVRGDPQRGWCSVHRCMRGNATPVLCRQWVPA